MSEAIRTRTSARGWATRASGKLDSLVGKAGFDLVELNDAIEEFDKRLTALDSAQEAVERELTEMEELMEDIEKAAAIRDKLRVSRLAAARLVISLSSASVKPDDSLDNASQASASKEAKLPKLVLPTFAGEPTEWQGFWDQFQAIVHNSEQLPDVTKFSYLLSLLKGEAKAAVQGLSLSSQHYSIACDILTGRYGRKERIIFHHLQDLLNLSVTSVGSNSKSAVSNLWKLQDMLLAHVRSLEALGVTGSQYGVVLTPLILSRLPQDLRLEWAREGEGRESDLDFLLSLLEKEIQRRERSQTFKTTISEEKRPSAPSSVPSAAALQSASGAAQVLAKCLVCDKGHRTEKCWDLTRVPLLERRDKMQKAGLCFKCLLKGHIAKGCTAHCSKCKGRHHALLCGLQNSTQEQTTSENSVTTTSHIACDKNVSKRVILQTAHVQVSGSRGTVGATVLFDTGSDRSYVSSELINKIQPEWVGAEPLAYAAFGTDKPSDSILRNIFKLNMKDAKSSSVSILATEVKNICSPVHCPRVPDEVLQSFGKLQFVAVPPEGKEVKVDILVGLDTYWRLVQTRSMMVSKGLVAQETIFGWMLSGSVRGESPGIESSSQPSHQLLCLDVSESIVARFWELEAIGVKDEPVVGEDPVLTHFKQNVTYVDGRYQVALPWKPGDSSKRLMSNESLAEKRLVSLHKRLAKTPELENRYNDALSELEASGVTEEVPEHELNSPYPVFYMPHRPVLRESSTTTKIRPVFDASAAGYNGVSLNNCLETGPNLLPNLVEILIRFRRWRIGVSGDITKAFLQIGVQRPDQDVHRFLWKDKDAVKVMRFVRVPFGNCSSPFLLNATIKHHLSTVPHTRVVEELEENFYVDDLLTGADYEQEACEIIRESTVVMEGASMSLAKWSSNNEAVADMLSREFSDKHIETESLKVLGLRWLPQSDCFCFDTLPLPDSLVVTKRVVLSIVSRLFDPLGLLTPFVMLGKCIFQGLWRLGLSWDEVVPEDVEKKVLQWVAGLHELQAWYVSRSYTGRAWQDNISVSLHSFGDASEQGYGACVYLVAKFSDGSKRSSLVTSRARVAPLKRISLPRLELLGALLCARLMVFVRHALKLPLDVEYYCWTDSTVEPC